MVRSLARGRSAVKPGSKRQPEPWRPRLRFGLVAIGLALAVPVAAQDDSPWAKGRQWMSIRLGYAKSAVEGAADGNIGGGFGYSRFLNSKWAIGALVDLNLLGKFGGAAEIESPWMIEIARHYRWPTAMRPFLAVGTGAYYHKFYRTGADAAVVRPGFHLAFGTHAGISNRALVGLDVRMNVVDLDKQANPVFGGQTSGDPSSRAVHWSAKGNLSLAF
jgi:hypothetical protein